MRVTCLSASLLVHPQGRRFPKEIVDSCEADGSIGPVSFSLLGLVRFMGLDIHAKNTPITCQTQGKPIVVSSDEHENLD